MAINKSRAASALTTVGGERPGGKRDVGESGEEEGDEKGDE